jgi:phage tail sheath protein FI
VAMTFKYPGVYVEEIQTGPRPIEAVGTSTAAFLGVAPNAGAHVQEPVVITNWLQFTREFCGGAKKGTPLAQAVYGFLDNGGSRCYVINVGEGGNISGKIENGQRRGIALCEEIDEVAIIAAPGYSTTETYEALLSHCEKLKDRFCILDAPLDVKRLEDLTQVGGAAPEAPAPTGAPARPRRVGLKPRESSYGSFYFPWLVVQDPLSGERANVPPSGHMAGVYARVDGTRGVHKAPANEPIRGVNDLTYNVTNEDQEALNPAGVNCIRFFSDAGIRVWGARTVDAAASEWRYINVRRLFSMTEESIGRGTRWVVFEPNDYTLWKSVRRDVSGFLTRLWRSGALFGRTPEEAFFVKCDEETNPPDVINAGQLITIVGMAPVKPAEFIVFRIGQYEAGTQIE